MSDAHYNEIGKKLGDNHGVESGQMFGKPCLKANGKAFAAFHKDAMIFKLGREEAPFLLSTYDGSHHWDPSGKGRPMKDWIALPSDHHEVWEEMAEKALHLLVESQG